MSKINLCIIFGGKSCEHEVSLQSAMNVCEALNPDKYEITLVAMDKKGRFFLCPEEDFIEFPKDPSKIRLTALDDELAFIPGEVGASFFSLKNGKRLNPIDVIFPILHGPYGEDGSVQGLFKLLNVPYVGADVVGSAVGMDKDIMKRLLRDAGVSISNFVVYRKLMKRNYASVKKKLGLPIFVKPANLGSSVGVSKVTDEESFHNALDLAFKYDHKVILEEFVEGREIECAVKGNHEVQVTMPGEIMPTSGFYSYEAKYIDANGAKLEIPAKIDFKTKEQIKAISKKVYKVLECRGLARIDFFLKGDEIIVNEINTLPGFTKISMYPKLWQQEGLQYADLIDELINLALKNYKEINELSTDL